MKRLVSLVRDLLVTFVLLLCVLATGRINDHKSEHLAQNIERDKDVLLEEEAVQKLQEEIRMEIETWGKSSRVSMSN